MMILSELITLRIFKTAAISPPGFLMTIWVGSRIFSKPNKQTCRQVALGILLLAGLYGMTL